MSEQALVFGVFENLDNATICIAALHKAGFKEAAINIVGKDCREFKYVSAKIHNPTKRAFLWFGSIGALAGLYVGPMLAPTIPYVVSFQVITTIMASVSSGIILAYMGQFMAAFLHADTPQYYANVYQGDLEHGAALISVEAESMEERLRAATIFEEHEAVEIVSRRAAPGPVIALDPACELQQSQNQPMSAAA